MAQLHNNPISQKLSEAIHEIEKFPPSPRQTEIVNFASELMRHVNVHEQELKGLRGHQWRDESGTVHGD